MYIRDYFYIKPTINCGDHMEIDGISREDYAVDQYIDITPKIVLDRKTAVLYAPGTGVSQSESRDSTHTKERYAGSIPLCKGELLIKELTSYHAHRWISEMENRELVSYVNINNNACASSMHSLYEAERLLRDDVVDEVIVISDERSSFNTIRIFKEHGIPVVVGDALAIVRLTKNGNGHEITNTKWEYEWNRNPFGVTKTGYLKVDGVADTVKTHGTGTTNNSEAEQVLENGRRVISYKKEIGHTQGASALLELCMLLDDTSAEGKILCVASGLGNVYGSCILHKIK